MSAGFDPLAAEWTHPSPLYDQGTGESDVPDVEQAVSRSRFNQYQPNRTKYLRPGLPCYNQAVRSPGWFKYVDETRYRRWHVTRGLPLRSDHAEHDAALLRRVGVVRHRLAQHQGRHSRISTASSGSSATRTATSKVGLCGTDVVRPLGDDLQHLAALSERHESTSGLSYAQDSVEAGTA
jgi:hypothetical protein